ncbi:uncharacterized protein LOC112550990 [Alligator sinensis]|uniref:Uncharacterized protein LOC112550990 n=1 Tax=Alligator sinensis TaxID=38654 RepID=A0A3Q0GZB7_ALLSI|nr:uncharacterized protein LOC112550990 [Alligator sinensis]
MVGGLEAKPYEGRSGALDLLSLCKRRLRDDPVATYKFIRGEQHEIGHALFTRAPLGVTRNNSHSLMKNRFRFVVPPNFSKQDSVPRLEKGTLRLESDCLHRTGELLSHLQLHIQGRKNCFKNGTVIQAIMTCWEWCPTRTSAEHCRNFRSMQRWIHKTSHKALLESSVARAECEAALRDKLCDSMHKDHAILKEVQDTMRNLRDAVDKSTVQMAFSSSPWRNTYNTRKGKVSLLVLPLCKTSLFPLSLRGHSRAL